MIVSNVDPRSVDSCSSLSRTCVDSPIMLSQAVPTRARVANSKHARCQQRLESPRRDLQGVAVFWSRRWQEGLSSQRPAEDLCTSTWPYLPRKFVTRRYTSAKKLSSACTIATIAGLGSPNVDVIAPKDWAKIFVSINPQGTLLRWCFSTKSGYKYLGM